MKRTDVAENIMIKPTKEHEATELTPEEIQAILQQLKVTTKENQIIAPMPEEIQTRLHQGRTYFEATRYIAALKEFNAILEVAPGNIETRIWIRKTRDKLSELKTGVVTKVVTPDEIKRKKCIWVKMGIISYRICTRNYDCLTCEFDQAMQDRMAGNKSPEPDIALEKFKDLPANQRQCRYALKGYISYRLCTRGYKCDTCEFFQMREDNLQKKLVRLAARRNSLGKGTNYSKMEARL